MLMQAKWFLWGQDVLFGRKTIRQRLYNIAESKGLSVKTQFCDPSRQNSPGIDPVTNKGNKRKFDGASVEEEVVEEGRGLKRCVKGFSQVFDPERSIGNQKQHVTERALIELILPCIDRSSDESRNSFASDLIKQLINIEQQISALTHGASKPAGSNPPGIEGTINKVNSRKPIKGGNPGLARRSAIATDSVPPSPAALRVSISLQLHLFMRFLPIICADR